MGFSATSLLAHDGALEATLASHRLSTLNFELLTHNAASTEVDRPHDHNPILFK
jgi:hypothetical protein